MLSQKFKNILLTVYLILIGIAVGLVAYKLIYTPIDEKYFRCVADWVLLLNIITTCFMTGLIWLVQMVNYPLFNKIGKDHFEDYHTNHVWRITTVVALPMLLEAVTSILMLFYPHPQIPTSFIWSGVILVFVIWISTLCLQVPQHDALLKSFDQNAYQKINRTNWIRTLAWSLRLILICFMICKVL